MTSNSLVLSTLTVSSINSGAPGVAAYSTLNVSSMNATSTITGSTINALTGSIGIGTNAPTQKLDIVNGASATMGVRLQSQYSAGYLSMGAVLGVNSYIGLQAGINTTSALTTPTLCVTNANNVGIGTANPGHLLDVNGSSTVLARFQQSVDFARISLDAPSGGDIIYKAAGVSKWGIACISNKLQFLLNDSTSTVPMTLDTTGFVGIGSTGPGYLLTVGANVNPTANSAGTTVLQCNGNLNIFRTRLIFSSAPTDWNHCIYNNSFNLDNEGAWDGMKFNVYSGAWFRVGNAAGQVPGTAMFMNTSGYVGIGTTTVSFPLTVWSQGGGYGPGGNNPYIISPTISVQNTSGYGIVSGWFQKDLIAGGAVGTFSDLRIKNNVQPVTNALETIDRLEMVSHGYIDHIQNRQSCSFGLIAQQVKHIVPDAVLLTTDYIPNIMCAPLTAALDGDHIILTFDHSIDLAVNNLLRFILKDRQVEQKVSYVSQDQTVIHVSAWSNPDPDHDQIFVYGKQVDDFHILDKPKMGLLALAGVKELMKQNAEQAEKITTLESQLTTVLSRLNAAGIA